MHDDSDDATRAVLSRLITAEPDRLRRRSISLGVPAADAEDAAQTSLLRAWRSVAHQGLSTAYRQPCTSSCTATSAVVPARAISEPSGPVPVMVQSAIASPVPALSKT